MVKTQERMGSDIKYVIDSSIYEKHINEKIHLYELLHQIGFLARKAADGDDTADLTKTALQFSEIAEEMFRTWNIPSRYLVFENRTDLADLKAAELEPLSSVLKAHDRVQKEKMQAASIHDMSYIISGSSFRLLVGDLFDLLALYSCLQNRVLDAKTDAQVARLRKHCSKENPMIRRLYRNWGIPKGDGVTCQNMLEHAISHTHLKPYNPERMEQGDSFYCNDSDFPDGEYE